MKKDGKKTKDFNFENKKIIPVFSDKRGDIFDLVEKKVGHIGIVTFKKGAVRGNHYHKKSTQYSYVLKGKIKLVLKDISGENKKELVLTGGELTKIPPKIIHTYTALSSAEMLDITTMSRTDNGYEKDTVRIK